MVLTLKSGHSEFDKRWQGHVSPSPPLTVLICAVTQVGEEKQFNSVKLSECDTEGHLCGKSVWGHAPTPGLTQPLLPQENSRR